MIRINALELMLTEANEEQLLRGKNGKNWQEFRKRLYKSFTSTMFQRYNLLSKYVVLKFDEIYLKSKLQPVIMKNLCRLT